MKRIRDSQRKRVYEWERPIWKDQPLMPLDEVAGVIAKIAEYYGVRPAKVGDGRGRRIACWCESTYTIKLPRWARNEMVVLHEAAHWITFERYGVDFITGDSRVAWHGPEFMGVYMHLLITFAGHTLKDLSASLNAAKVRFRIVDRSKPRKR